MAPVRLSVLIVWSQRSPCIVLPCISVLISIDLFLEEPYLTDSTTPAVFCVFNRCVLDYTGSTDSSFFTCSVLFCLLGHNRQNVTVFKSLCCCRVNRKNCRAGKLNLFMPYLKLTIIVDARVQGISRAAQQYWKQRLQHAQNSN